MKWANSEMSAPATNAFSPLPVSIIAFIFKSLSSKSKALCSSYIVTLFKAFNFFGLLIVICAKAAVF